MHDLIIICFAKLAPEHSGSKWLGMSFNVTTWKQHLVYHATSRTYFGAK